MYVRPAHFDLHASIRPPRSGGQPRWFGPNKHIKADANPSAHPHSLPKDTAAHIASDTAAHIAFAHIASAPSSSATTQSLQLCPIPCAQAEPRHNPSLHKGFFFTMLRLTYISSRHSRSQPITKQQQQYKRADIQLNSVCSARKLTSTCKGICKIDKSTASSRGQYRCSGGGAASYLQKKSTASQP